MQRQLCGSTVLYGSFVFYVQPVLSSMFLPHMHELLHRASIFHDLFLTLFSLSAVFGDV